MLWMDADVGIGNRKRCQSRTGLTVGATLTVLSSFATFLPHPKLSGNRLILNKLLILGLNYLSDQQLDFLRLFKLFDCDCKQRTSLSKVFSLFLFFFFFNKGVVK